MAPTTTPPKEKKVELSFTNWVLGGSLLSINSSQTTGVSKRVRKVVVSQDGAKAVVEKPKEVITVEVKKNDKKDDTKSAEPTPASPKPASVKSTHSAVATTTGREWTVERDEKIKSMKADNKSWKEISQATGASKKDVQLRFKELSSSPPAETVTETFTETPVEEVAETGFGGLVGEDLNFGCGDWGAESTTDKDKGKEGEGEKVEMSGALDAWGEPVVETGISGGTTGAWGTVSEATNNENNNSSGGGFSWGATAAQKDGDKDKSGRKGKKQKGGGGSGGSGKGWGRNGDLNDNQNQNSNQNQTDAWGEVQNNNQNENQSTSGGWGAQQNDNQDTNQNQNQGFGSGNNNSFSPAKSHSSPHPVSSSLKSQAGDGPCQCPDCLLKDPYPSKYPHSNLRLRPDNIWSRDDCEILEELDKRYRENKWLQIQAAFFNWTGRMVEGEIIERKFRGDGFI